MNWILANKEWLFSGIGVFILSLVISILFKKFRMNKQVQKSGNNSTNYQAAGNIAIGNQNDER
jgi:membrane protein implicated in regulation of membrane protease activity